MNETSLMMILLAVALGVIGLLVFFLTRKSPEGRDKAEMQELRASQQNLLQERTRAVTERDEMKRQLEEIKGEREHLRDKAGEAEKRVHQAEKTAELLQQKNTTLEARMQEWEKMKEEMTQNAKASLLKAGSELSSKLLEDHKREATEQKKQQEEHVRQTTEKLFQQFNEVSKTVFSLREDTTSNRQQMENVMRALTNPGGAGAMAEVGLENSLKNLGLEPGRDFVMQYHIPGEEGHSLRPDAVIFLPRDMVMVVDAKASKFLIELEETRGTEREAETREKLKKTMQKHVSDLASKDYKSAIQQSYREAGREGNIGRVLNVMYMPTDHALMHIQQSDPGFSERLEKCELIPTGPTGLAGLFLLARMQIAEARQLENHERIIEVVQQLIDGVGSMLSHVESLGKGIRTTAESFKKLGGSANRNILPKLKRLEKLGALSGKNRELPKPVVTYEVHRSEETITLEADEVSEVEPIALVHKETA